MERVSFLLPHLVGDGRGALELLHAGLQPGGGPTPKRFRGFELLTDPPRSGSTSTLTPTWQETAQYDDYVHANGRVGASATTCH